MPTTRCGATSESGPRTATKPWWLRDHRQNSFVFQIAGVGGTTLHYFGNCPRPAPGCFAGYTGADRSAYDTSHLFPFTYEEIRPYFEWVEATLPVQTAPMGTKEAVFFRGCEGVGLPVQTTKDITRDAFRPQENAILQPGGTAGRTRDSSLLTYPEATGCTFCGYCPQGCVQPRLAPRNLKAKRSTDNSYVPMALTAGSWAPGGRDVTLVADAFVTRIRTAPATARPGRASGVTWRDVATGAVHTEDAKVVVMAGGCVEDPRLWLNSGLPNPNGWVGRGLTDHAFDWVTGVFDEDTDSSKGPASACRADFPGRGGFENIGLPPGMEALSVLISDSGVRGGYDTGQGLTGAWDGETGRPLGLELKDLMRDVNKLLNILVITDDDVESQNRVNLSPLPPDGNGRIPKVRMHKRRRTARTRANREFLAARAAEVLRAAGAAQGDPHRHGPPHAAHAVIDADGIEPVGLGARPDARGPVGQGPLHRRQRSAGELRRRRQPHPDHPGRGHTDGGGHLLDLLRWRPVGGLRGTGQLHRRPCHPSSAGTRHHLIACPHDHIRCRWDSTSKALLGRGHADGQCCVVRSGGAAQLETGW